MVLRGLRRVLREDRVTLSVFDVVNWVINLGSVQSGLGFAIDVVRKDTLQLIVPRDRVLVEVLAHSLQYNRLEEIIKEIQEVECLRLHSKNLNNSPRVVTGTLKFCGLKIRVLLILELRILLCL